MGRWISQDPAGFIDGPNLYAYLHNNPTNHIDRFGLATEPPPQKKLEDYMYGEYETHCFCEKHRTCKRGGDIGKTVASLLPKVRYCDEFENRHMNHKSKEDFWAHVDSFDVDDFRPYYEPSKIYNLGLPELTDMEIGFINGMDNNFNDSRKSAIYVSRLAGGCNVHAVYNATHGKTVDLIECKMGLNYTATEPVRQLHNMWNNFFERSSANAKYLMICHSQGAIHVRNALLDYPPELQERILVVGIAPAGYIYRETCAQVVHYRVEKRHDIVPYLDQEGANRSKDTIIELNSRNRLPYFIDDHSLTNSIYEAPLLNRIDTYINTRGKRI